MEEERTTQDADSLGKVVSDFMRELGTLVRQELDLARCELAQNAREAKGGATGMGVGAVLATAGVLTACAALVLGGTLILQQWMDALLAGFVSALAVAIVLGAAGYGLIRSGARRMSPARFVPRRTVESIKEDARWARTRL